MSFIYRPCEMEMDNDGYVKFLIQNHESLNLPYPFAMKLSFLGSPLAMGRTMLVFNDEPYRIVGAAGFVYGTGANNYEDKQICQIEVAFTLKEYRSTYLFIHGLQTLLGMITADNPKVDRVQFWVPGEDAYLKKLLSKFAALPGSVLSSGKSEGQILAFYSLSFVELQRYCERFRLTTT